MVDILLMCKYPSKEATVNIGVFVSVLLATELHVPRVQTVFNATKTSAKRCSEDIVALVISEIRPSWEVQLTQQ